MALLPATLLCTEALYRGWTAAVGEPYSATDTRAAIERVAGEVDQTVGRYAPRASRTEAGEANPELHRIQHPFFGWDFPQVQQRTAETTDYFRTPEAEANYDIVIVGGSVANGFASKPWLAERLSSDPRFELERIRVHDRAFGGCKQPQQLNIVSYLFSLDWRPDAVINLDGYNDMALSARNADRGAHPLHPSTPHWGYLVSNDPTDRGTLDLQLDMRRQQRLARETADGALLWRLDRSAILGRLTLARLHRIRREYSRSNELYADAIAATVERQSLLGPPFDGAFEEVMDTAVRAWVESSRSLRAICDARGVTYLHVLQPTLHDVGSKPLTREEVDQANDHGTQVAAIANGYPRLRLAGRELREQGLHFVDASMVFEHVERTLYRDMCHFNAEGNGILADTVARELLRVTP